MMDDPLMRAMLFVALVGLIAGIGAMVWLHLGRPKHYGAVFWTGVALSSSSLILAFTIAGLTG